MVTKVLKTASAFGIAQGATVLVALSGGVDSSVLLDILIRKSEELSISVVAAHLNHMLRGEDADSDEAFVREKCREYGIRFYSERIDIKALSEKSGESTELAARNARYEFLHRAKEKLSADYIATAHNANDNLETILMNLTRGGGIRGLCGIPQMRGEIIRPLIGCTRDEIEEYAKENGISFCVDKTNDETVYSRNKVRHLVVPTLLSLNPSAIENAMRTSEILRCEAAFLDNQAEAIAEKIRTAENACDKTALLSERALVSRVCNIFAAKALGRKEYSIEYKHTQMILSLAESENPSGKISLPGGLLVRRRYEEISFEKESDTTALSEVTLLEGENFCGEYVITVKKGEKNQKINTLLNTFFVPCDRIQGNLVVRPRREGDEIKLSKRRTKSIKKLFVDEKVPRSERENIPVIADDEKVFGVFGFGADERCSEGKENGYFIKINRK